MQPHGKRKCMWFSGERIGDEGAKQLATILAKDTTLTSLDLQGTRWCNVTPAFVCICMHMSGCCAVMQSRIKPNANPGLSAAPNTNANTNANPGLTSNPNPEPGKSLKKNSPV